MTALWGILAVVLLVALLFALFKRVRPVWVKLLLIVVILLGLGFSLFKFVFPMNEGPSPTGPYAVRTERVFYTHQTAIPQMATAGSNREVPVSLWLPEGTGGEHALVIFSHGSFGIEESNPSLFNDLASNGYVVASLGHPHHSFTTTLSDGTRANLDWGFFQEVVGSKGAEDASALFAEFNKWKSVRVEDISFALDSLLADENYAGAIDEGQVFLAGHSLGGSAALEVGRARSGDVQGVIALESPYFGDITGVEGNRFVFTDEEYPVPVLHFYSDALWGKLEEITTYEMNQRLLEAGDDRFVNVHVEGSGHIGLSELSLSSPLLTNLFDEGLNTRDAFERVSQINAATLDFLDAHTK
ncbi:MAG: hypothetical protein Q4D87_09415 [Actinomycetaceae bacterium]|nr:hypothetical protein [Actinomycetaceae bacterium]